MVVNLDPRDGRSSIQSVFATMKGDKRPLPPLALKAKRFNSR